MPDQIIQLTETARLTSLPLLSRRLLRGEPAAIRAAFALDVPTSPHSTSIGANDRILLWLGPDEWLLLAPAGVVLPDWDDDTGASVDVSHRQVSLLLRGSGADVALAVGCPLDLAVPAFPVGACRRTVFGKAEIVLWRRGVDEFHIEVWRSFVAYVRGLLEIGIADGTTR